MLLHLLYDMFFKYVDWLQDIKFLENFSILQPINTLEKFVV